MPLVLQNRLLDGQAGLRIFVAFGCGDFCLPGAIAVKQDFLHSNGSISITNSSAGNRGGALLLSSSRAGTTCLWPAEDQRGPKRDHLRDFVFDVSGRVLLANGTLCDMSFVLCLVCSTMFSSISSQGWISLFPLHFGNCLL